MTEKDKGAASGASEKVLWIGTPIFIILVLVSFLFIKNRQKTPPFIRLGNEILIALPKSTWDTDEEIVSKFFPSRFVGLIGTREIPNMWEKGYLTETFSKETVLKMSRVKDGKLPNGQAANISTIKTYLRMLSNKQDPRLAHLKEIQDTKEGFSFVFSGLDDSYGKFLEDVFGKNVFDKRKPPEVEKSMTFNLVKEISINNNKLSQKDIEKLIISRLKEYPAISLLELGNSKIKVSTKELDVRSFCQILAAPLILRAFREDICLFLTSEPDDFYDVLVSSEVKPGMEFMPTDVSEAVVVGFNEKSFRGKDDPRLGTLIKSASDKAVGKLFPEKISVLCRDDLKKEQETKKLASLWRNMNYDVRIFFVSPDKFQERIKSQNYEVFIDKLYFIPKESPQYLARNPIRMEKRRIILVPLSSKPLFFLWKKGISRGGHSIGDILYKRDLYLPIK